MSEINYNDGWNNIEHDWRYDEYGGSRRMAKIKRNLPDGFVINAQEDSRYRNYQLCCNGAVLANGREPSTLSFCAFKWPIDRYVCDEIKSVVDDVMRKFRDGEKAISDAYDAQTKRNALKETDRVRNEALSALRKTGLY